MSSHCLDPRPMLVALVMAGVAAAVHAAGEAPLPTALRVCVDPDNLPYSHADGRGYEPRVARILADELNLPLQLHWQPMRRGIVRKTLAAHECDVLMSVPKGLERVLTTRPYYRSSYVFVTRADDPQPLHSFDDPRLAQLRVGVQLVGNDLAATPPGHALVRQGAVKQVVGYTVDGGSGEGEGPAAQRMAAALAAGRLDAVLAWGPQAGYFARQSAVPLRVWPAVAPEGLGLPFDFGMAVAVRKDDVALRDRLQAALEARADEIAAVLDAHGVPRIERPEAAP